MITFPGITAVEKSQLSVGTLINYTGLGLKFKCDVCEEKLTVSYYKDSKPEDRIICSKCSGSSFSTY
ncbi:hypothetical protein 2050HW_00353 [Serratia phage vB_SmaM_ 2050HW]|uniref:Uncharacterized protein n=1 Tax=Serratia phage vB_SmaM_ 2050HW TaxID=2024252 RepID=A0A289ZUE2_9CAUD|nr:hypothetical protein HWB23_gp353 [Serratia phage vB_SmaM_ 2050HW]ATA65688.1 hypothetical protein 2050HW_00353 [Serratia phage vB_SmaM_ 2050HW]